MRHIFSLLIFTISLMFYAPKISAQLEPKNTENIIEIRNGIFIETIPATFQTVRIKNDNPPSYEWVVIPAKFEMITETQFVQEAYEAIDIIPPTYKSDGSIDVPAEAKLRKVPAITRQVSRQVMKTPSSVQKRIVPLMCNLHRTKRQKVKNAVYIVRDANGKELRRYEDTAKLADFINTD